MTDNGGDYEKIKQIGKGAYGVVYQCRHKVTGEVVALKDIALPRPKQVDEDKEANVEMPPFVVREISILKEVSNHPHIVRLRDVVLEVGRWQLIFEYLPMDLHQYIASHGADKQVEMGKIKSLVYQLLRGLTFLHQRRVLHRDLKPENLLLDGQGILKIADFGFAKTYTVPMRKLSHNVGTLWYRAPELILGSTRYSCSIDVWAVGCIFGELVTKFPLFPGHSTDSDQLGLIFRVLGTPTETIWPGVSTLPGFKTDFPTFPEIMLETFLPRLAADKDGMDLLKKMLIYSPAARIGTMAAFNHPFFDNLDKRRLPTFED